VPPTVLIVDDDPAFLALATRMLENLGAHVAATAGTAMDALAAAHAVRPVAALVDVGLPDRNGIDLARDLVALSWRPRVVLTSSDRDSAPTAAEDGAVPFVPKEELPNAPLRELFRFE
jgi:two-component system nitrate/nitrite response regulator NarL